MLRKCSPLTMMLTILLFFGGMTSVFAEGGKKEWQFSKEIDIKEASQYKSLFLDEEVYANSRKDLADLRIVDGEGKFVPYYLESGYGETSVEETIYMSEVVQKMEKTNETVIDFLIHPLHTGTDVQGNVVKVSLPDQAFLKNVEVFGSYDGNRWESIGDYKLYNTDQVTMDTVNLGNVYKYTHYRLRIMNNAEKVDFQKIQLIHNQQSSSWNVYTEHVVPEYKVSNEERETRITIENVQRLKVIQIFLEMDGNFRRTFRLEDQDGNYLTSGSGNELYNLNFEDIQIDNTTISMAVPIVAEEIIIIINNDDNPPLDVGGLSYEYYIDQLVFEDNGSESYQLIYGNPNARKPVYDIVDFKAHIQRGNPSAAYLGDEVEVPIHEAEKEPSWFQTKMVFNIVIGLVSILLIILIGQKLKGPKN